MRFLSRLLISAVALLPLACTAATPAAEFKEGQQYAKVREAQPQTDTKKVLVEEFFWYGCPHCFHFDPSVEAWRAKKPADVDFVRVPMSLGHEQGMLHSKAYYTEQALGLGDKIHRPMFLAIHEQHRMLGSQQELQAFFTAQTGVLPEVFNNTFNSFTVATQVNKAEALARSYGIASVPTLVVGGEYTTSVAMGGTPEQTFKIVDFLIEKVRQERRGKGK